MKKTNLFVGLLALGVLDQTCAAADRGNMFGISETVSVTTDPSATAVGLDLIYKWNFRWVEIGPTLTGTYLSGGGVSAWAARGGAQCDVNFFRNMQGNEFIPGVRLLGDYGFSGGSSAGTSDIHPVTYGGDVFMKFFMSSS
ncbi:MAG: hypothetical protein KGQ59_07145, partial [Bdellovibrionales bacterium]|nr:hypothetical protein [Bdellovibrionales bacterium]